MTSYSGSNSASNDLAPLPPQPSTQFVFVTPLDPHPSIERATPASPRPIQGAIAPLQPRFMARAPLNPIEADMIARVLHNDPKAQ